MRPRFFVLLLFCFGSSARADLKVDDLPDLIKNRNRHAQALQFEYESADRRTGYLVRSFLPSLTLTGGGETFRAGPSSVQSQPYGGVEASINLFRGGRDWMESVARDADREQKRLEAADTYFDELSQARKVFWDIAFQQELIALLEAGVKQNAINRESAERRIRGGLATQSDRLEFNMAQVEFDQDISRARISLANSERKLSALVGNPLTTNYPSISRIPHEHDDAILGAKIELDQHRQIKKIETKGIGLDAKKAQTLRYWAPALDIYGGHALYTVRDRDYAAANDRQDTYVGIRLTLNLFDGLHSIAEGKALALEAQAEELRRSQTREELDALYQGSVQELKLIHSLIHDAEKSVEQSALYLRSTLSEYQRGVKNSLDVLSASGKSLGLKRRYLELRRDYQMAKVELLSILGK